KCSSCASCSTCNSRRLPRSPACPKTRSRAGCGMLSRNCGISSKIIRSWRGRRRDMTRMDCHTLEQQLMDFLYQELATDEMAEVRAHLGECPRCSAEIERFQSTRRAVSVLELVEPSGAVSAKILHQAALHQKRPLWRRSRTLHIAALATPLLAAAAAVLIVFHMKEPAMPAAEVA